MVKLQVTLDTNVLVAGLRSRGGASFQILSIWLEGRFRACVSVPLWLEYEAVLKREHIAAGHGLSAEDIDVLLATFAAHIVPVELNFTWRPQLRDPKDEMVFDTALNGRSEALVTFNRDDFSKPAAKFGLKLWTPRELLRRSRLER